MKKGWQMKRLGEVCKTGAGGTPSKIHSDYYENGDIPWIRSGEVNNRNITESEIKITLKGLNNSSAKLFPASTVVIAMYGATAGQVGILNFECATNQAVCGIFPNKDFIPEFLYYFFLKFKEELIAQAVGNAQPNISQTKIRNTLIPIVSIELQKQIVALLDAAFAKIDQAKANIEKNIENARELFQSKLNEIFSQQGEGWEEDLLVNLCEEKRIITYGVIKLGEHDSNGIPCLRTSNVRWLHIDINGMKKISSELSLNYKRTILQGGEVLVNVRGTLGGVAVVPDEMRGWNISREVACVPIDQLKVNSNYLAYLIGSNFSQNWLSGVKKGATYIGINLEDLRKLPISFPSLEQQILLVNKANSLQIYSSQIQEFYQKKISHLEELKKSLLQQAFAGELTSIDSLNTQIPVES